MFLSIIKQGYHNCKIYPDLQLKVVDGEVVFERSSYKCLDWKLTEFHRLFEPLHNGI